MKKAGKKKSTMKKAKKPKKPVKTQQAPTSASAVKGRVEDGKIDKQPQVKEQAAVANAMFLYGDDSWAQRYFDQNDLHFLEREVFG